MKPAPFVMSEKTRDDLKNVLDKLDEENKPKLLDAISSLCAEVEMHTIKKAMETLRQEWAETLRVMFSRLPEKGGK